MVLPCARVSSGLMCASLARALTCAAHAPTWPSRRSPSPLLPATVPSRRACRRPITNACTNHSPRMATRSSGMSCDVTNSTSSAHSWLRSSSERKARARCRPGGPHRGPRELLPGRGRSVQLRRAPGTWSARFRAVGFPAARRAGANGLQSESPEERSAALPRRQHVHRRFHDREYRRRGYGDREWCHRGSSGHAQEVLQVLAVRDRTAAPLRQALADEGGRRPGAHFHPVASGDAESHRLSATDARGHLRRAEDGRATRTANGSVSLQRGQAALLRELVPAQFPRPAARAHVRRRAHHVRRLPVRAIACRNKGYGTL